MGIFTSQIQTWVLASEGGYADHPSDPGGATNMGITHRTLAAWRKVGAVSKDEVRALGRAEAIQIYETQYWRTSGADRLPVGVDYAVFDYAVNSGPQRAVKDLQRVLGVAADGIVGLRTLEAAKEVSPEEIIKALCKRRREYVRGLRHYQTFRRGWEDRINRVERNALSLVSPVASVTPAPSEGKAPPERPTVVDTVLKDAGGLSGVGAVGVSLFAAIANQPILQVAAVLLIGVLVWRFVIAKRDADPS